jgi:hypothetical protein
MATVLPPHGGAACPPQRIVRSQRHRVRQKWTDTCRVFLEKKLKKESCQKWVLAGSYGQPHSDLSQPKRLTDLPRLTISATRSIPRRLRVESQSARRNQPKEIGASIRLTGAQRAFPAPPISNQQTVKTYRATLRSPR